MGCACDTHCPAASPTCPQGGLTIAIAGNPNCGKSALFNALTGIHQRTGNWPGVTVDRKEGHCQIGANPCVVIDLPGIYSLDATSMDEQVSRDYLLAREADVIVNLVDANNLERNLYFTLQLLEMGVPMVVAVNMMDVARERGMEIDTRRLAAALGCPVLPIVAVTGEGLERLGGAILEVAHGETRGGRVPVHAPVVEEAVGELAALMADEDPANARWLGLKLLEGDALADTRACEAARQRVGHWQNRIRELGRGEPDIFIADSRFEIAREAAAVSVIKLGQVTNTLTDRIDRIALHRYAGVPLFLAVMYLMFTFTIHVGGALVDFFDGMAGALLVDGLGHWLKLLGSPQWLVVLLADGVGGGLQVVASFVPIITALYLFLSVLEDSGYMARAAFVMDRFMGSIGLPGKAFVPLIVGFGCNVPAVMATRTLDNERERKLTVLMNPFMSCGARLPVYVLFGAAFFPNSTGNLVFGLYLAGILAAVFTGLAMKRSLLKGESSGFLMELPDYRRPQAKGVALRTWDRLRMFVLGAGKIIVAMVVVLNMLNSIGTDGSFGNEDSDSSVLSAAARQATPLFAPMGIREDNWAATVGIFSGILAKEVVVGTLSTLYTDGNSGDDGEVFDLFTALAQAAATVPKNLSAVLDRMTDPLGLEPAAADTTAVEGMFGVMASRFDGQAGAFAYLLFILLYFPCVATIGVIARETGRAWAAFVAAWTTVVAYLAASGFYQAATFSRHPEFSGLWLAASAVFIAAALWGLRRWSGRRVCPKGLAVTGP